MPRANAHTTLAHFSFETAMAELETLTRAMENGDMPLEESLAAYQRGVELVKHCQQKLHAVEEQVKILEGDFLKPFVPLSSATSPDRKA